MDETLLFAIVNAMAFFSWLLLIVFPASDLVKKILTGIVISGFALLYTYLLSSGFQVGSFENFNSLEGLAKLFSNQTAILGGWIHYLAFDLMVGMYITKNALKFGISRWLLLPCLVFTFMLGPLGLLLYFIIRGISTRHYFHKF